MKNVYEVSQIVSEEALQMWVVLNYHNKPYELSFEDLEQEVKKDSKQVYRILKELRLKGLWTSIPKSNKKLKRDENFYKKFEKEEVEDTTPIKRPIAAKTGNFLTARAGR